MPEVKELIDLAVEDKGQQFVELVTQILMGKGGEQLADLKKEVAQTMFKKDGSREEQTA